MSTAPLAAGMVLGMLCGFATLWWYNAGRAPAE